MNKIVNIKLIYLLLIAVILSSCITNTNPNRVTKEEVTKVLNNEKAIVVLSQETIIPSGLFSYSATIKTLWTNYHKEREVMFKNFNIALIDIDHFSHKDIEFYVVEPGDYYLTLIDITKKTADYINSSFLEGILGAFTVKPGEVVYLGNMQLNLEEYNTTDKYFWQKGTTIKDEFDKYKEKIARRHPELKDRIVKRLMILNEKAEIIND